MSETLDPSNIVMLGVGFWGPKVLLSAVELGLFTELGQGPLDAETLRTRLRLHERSARDFFDALVALGMLERRDGRYSNTKETAHFLDRSKPDYIGGLLEMLNGRLYGFWGSLTEGLRTGEPQNEVKTGQGDIFDTLYSDPQRLRGFLQAMTGLSMGTAMAMARKFPWKEHKRFVDVGCAQGCIPVQVALANPHITGGGFDLEVVKPIFQEYLKRFGLESRLAFQSGNFFEDPLPEADVLSMGRILHDWDLEKKMDLLKKAHAALPKGGALIVYESLIDDDRRRNVAGLLMSLNMLIETRGGFDFTGADCTGWMKKVGFSKTFVEHLHGPDSMAVGIK
jgi:O-methyltransferase/methyltransferase family protein